MHHCVELNVIQASVPPETHPSCSAGLQCCQFVSLRGATEALRYRVSGHNLVHLTAISAEEIAFAVRNAKIFELALNAYCKQRQGQSSCKGCKRPLGSWTPCAKNHPGDNTGDPIMSPHAVSA